MPHAERIAAQAALDAVPAKLRGFWVAHFQLVPDTGDFIGLVCRVCSCWAEYAHDDKHTLINTSR